jgi:hypothetical protein
MKKYRTNYYFSLDDARSVDAGPLGNATRFVNDDRTKADLNTAAERR